MWGLDEKLFGAMYSASKSWFRRHQPSASALALDEVKARLQYICSLLSGEALSVRESESVGGYRGNILLLPRIIDLPSDSSCDDSNRNYFAYQFRVLYTLASRQREVHRQPQDSWNDYLCTLLEVAPTLRRVIELWPRGYQQLLGALGFAEAQAIPDRRLLLFLLRLEDNSNTRPLIEALLAIDRSHRQRYTPNDLGDTQKWPQIRDASLQELKHSLPRPRRAFPSSELIGQLLPAWSAAATSPSNPFPLPDTTKHRDAPTTELSTTPRDYVHIRPSPPPPEQENPVLHNFEKVHTADHYSGGQRRSCGDDELQEHKKALDELNLRDIIRSHQRSASVYRSKIILDHQGSDANPTSRSPLCYPEWDHRRQSYRPDYCSVFEQRIAAVPADKATQQWINQVNRQYRQESQKLRAELQRIHDTRRPATRQRCGEEIDIDALIRGLSDLRAGQCHNNRWYIRQRRILPHCATVMLLDLSHSSDAYIQGTRVLQIIRETTLLFAQTFESLGYPVEIATFYGNTHQDCRYQFIKEFHEPWSRAWQRLAACTPRGYTRIGAALRHATGRLLQSQARRQSLILISDAKPTDFDGYEGRHGEMDVRKALQEARSKRIVDFNLVLSASRGAHHDRMFVQHRYANAASTAEATRRLLQHLRRQIRR